MDVYINTICSTLLLIFMTGLLCSSISTTALDTNQNTPKQDSEAGSPEQKPPSDDLKFSPEAAEAKNPEEENKKEEEEIESLSKTTLPATTASTSPKPAVEEGDLVVKTGDKICVRVALKATFKVKYASVRSGKKKFHDAVINLPEKVSVTGSCDSNHSSIQIAWSNNTYVFKIEFGTIKGGKSKRDVNTKLPGWTATSISFTFSTKDDTHFQNPVKASSHTVRTKTSESYFTAERNQSYACNSRDDLTLHEYNKNNSLNNAEIQSVHLEIWNTHVQGFDIQPSGKFSQTLTCEEDVIDSLPKKKVVPIIVAACLAGLIVIIIIAYFISKNMSHSAYRPMA